MLDPHQYCRSIKQYVIDRACLDELIRRTDKIRLDISLSTTLELCADLTLELNEYHTAICHWEEGSLEYRSFAVHRTILEGLEEKLKYQQGVIAHTEVLRKGGGHKADYGD